MVEEGERSEVQQLAAKRRIKALERMEAERLEAKLQQEDELQHENNIRKEAELRWPEFNKTEEGGGVRYERVGGGRIAGRGRQEE